MFHPDLIFSSAVALYVRIMFHLAFLLPKEYLPLMEGKLLSAGPMNIL